MNEKLKWFGMYLGCEFIAKRVGVRHTLNASRLANLFTPNYESYTETCKLILKELKDITEEDLSGLNKLRSSLIDWDLLAFKTKDIIRHLRWHEIDFLRSKGYAVGIDKKYYITEDELK